jgi:ribosomal protein S18 acetylase RimI-like enzyme
MKAGVEEAKTTCRSIRLCVVSSNDAAIRLYESFGFSVWAKEVEALKVGDVYHDEILMRLDTSG